MAKVEMIVLPDGTVKVTGEGFATTGLKNAMRSVGEIIEEHIGHEHVKEVHENKEQNKA